MNSEPFELWKLTSSQKSQSQNLFSCSNSPILDSNRPVFFHCPPLHPKLSLANLKFNNLFTRNLNLEEQLGIARKEYHWKSFEGRQCSKLLSCSALLKELVPPSDHPLVECLNALHRVLVGVFGEILDPEFENDMNTFKEKFMGAMLTHNQKYMCSTIMYQNMCAVPQLHLGLLLSRRWRASIDFFLFSTTDSK